LTPRRRADRLQLADAAFAAAISAIRRALFLSDLKFLRRLVRMRTRAGARLRADLRAPAVFVFAIV